MPKQIKSSQDTLRQATGQLDPDKEILNNNKVELTLIKEQNNSLKQIKQTLSVDDFSEEDYQNSVMTSLKSSVGYLSSISGRLSYISTTVSSLKSVVSPMVQKLDTTVTLLGSIKTSLSQITGVLSAFRADYLMVANGVTPRGESYINKALIQRDLQPLLTINSETLKKVTVEMRKAALFADLMSNAVRKKIGNNKMAKEDEGEGLFSKILGKLSPDMAEYGELALQFLPVIGAFTNREFDDTNVKTLLSSIVGKEKSKKFIDPLNEMIGSWMNSPSNGKLFDVRKLFAGKINELTGLGDDVKTLEREKDPNLVMSALAPLADDIRDMVSSKFEMVKKKPKMIPIYAKPVWVVNSKYQENGLEAKFGKKLVTNEADFDEKRLIDLISGRATNKKDIDGRDLLTMNLKDGEVGGAAFDKFFDKYFPNASYNDKLEYIAHEKEKQDALKSKDLTSTTITTRDSLGRWQQSKQKTIAGVLDRTDMSGIDDVGGILSGIMQAAGGDIIGGGITALMGGATKLFTREGRNSLGESIKSTAGTFSASMKDMQQSNKEADKKINIPDKFNYLVATKVKEFLGYDEKTKVSREDQYLIDAILGISLHTINFNSEDDALNSLIEQKENLIREFKNIFPDEPEKADALYNIIENCAMECWNYNIPEKGISKLLNSMGTKVLGGLERFAEGHSGGRKARKRANKKKNKKVSKAVTSPKATNKESLIDDTKVEKDATPVITKASDTIVPKVHAEEEDATNLLNQTTATIAAIGNEVAKGIQAEEAQLTILTGGTPTESKDKTASVISKVLSKTPVGKTKIGALVLSTIGSGIKLPKFKTKPDKQEHKKLSDLTDNDKDKENNKEENKEEGEKKENLVSKLSNKLSNKIEEQKNKLTEKVKKSKIVKKFSGIKNKFGKIKENSERTIDSVKNMATQKVNKILKGEDGKGGLMGFGRRMAFGKTGKGGLFGFGKRIVVGKSGKGGLFGLGKRMVIGKDGKGGLKGFGKKIIVGEDGKGGLVGKAKNFIKNKEDSKIVKFGKRIALGKSGKGGLFGLGKKIAVGKSGSGGLLGLSKKAKNHLDEFNEKYGGKTQAEKEKERQEKLDKATEEATKKEVNAAEEAAKEREDTQKEIDNEKKDAAEKAVKTETSAATENAATETATQNAINAEQTARTTAREAQETSGTMSEVATEEASTKSLVLLEKAKAAGRWALEKAGTVAGAGVKLLGSLGKGILKILSGSTVGKIAAVGVGAALVGLITKISKKVLNSAKKGKEPKLDNVKMPSIKLNKDDKEDKKSKQKVSKAEKSSSDIFEPNKVYLNKEGLVIDAATEKPVKVKDKNGNDTDRILNYHDESDRKQIIKRIKNKELTLIKNKKINNNNINNNLKTKKEVSSYSYQNNTEIQIKNQKNKNINLNNIKNSTAKLAKFAFMMSNPILFAGVNVIKNLKRLKDSPFGQLMSKNPNKASDILSNTGSTGAALSVTDNASNTEVSKNNGKGFWTGIFDKIFGLTEKEKKSNMSSNLEDSSTDNASLALNKSYVSKGLRSIVSKFKQKLGLSEINDETTEEEKEAEKISGTKRAHGEMTTSEIYEKERARAYVQTINGGISGTTSNSSVAGGVSSSSPANGQLASEWFLNDLKSGGATISSGVGPRWGTRHNGTDYAAANGTPVHTPVAGKVTDYGDGAVPGDMSANGRRGNFVDITDSKGNRWCFYHFNKNPLVKLGDTVRAGQQIGEVGTTGQSTGNHLHVGLYDSNGNVLDTETYRFGRGKKKAIIMDGMDKPPTEENKTKFGRGDHLWQREFSLLPFNTSMDTEPQTLGDSGCGPAAAATVKNIYNKRKLYGKGKEEDKNKDKKEKDSTKEKTSEVKASEKSTKTDPSTLIGKTVAVSGVSSVKEITITQETIDVWNICISAGCSEAAAIGVLANICKESGANGESWRKQAENPHGTGGAGGILQWDPYSKHRTWCSNNNQSNPDSWEANLAHVSAILTGQSDEWAGWRTETLSSNGYSSCKTIDEYRALNDYKDATVNFERGYEGSADWANDKCASRIAFADAFYSAFKGMGAIGSTSTASPMGLNGIIEIKLDNYVDTTEAISKYMTNPGVYHKEDEEKKKESEVIPTNKNQNESITADLTNELNNISTAKPNKNTSSATNSNANTNTNISENIKPQVTIGGGNNTSNIINNNPSITNKPSTSNSNITTQTTNTTNNINYNNKNNNSSIIKPTEYNVTTTNTSGIEKTVITTNTGGTIIICNNYDKNIKTDLDEIVGNFKHLNTTQSKALKVLKAISDLIKDNDEEDKRMSFILNDDGLDWILKGI